MAEDKVITLRFQEWKAMDMELYRKLEKGKAELGLSMPAYVKGILRQHVEDSREGVGGADVCREQIREVVRGELASQSAILVGTIERIAEGLMDGTPKHEAAERFQEREVVLPEYSDDLPDGMEGILEKFM